METQCPVAAKYKKGVSKRDEVKNRAEENARFTIPSLMPEEGHQETDKLPKPWQAVGARGINNLASRVMLTLFPPNTANWRGSISEKAAQEAGMDDEDKGEFDAALSQYEQEFRRNFEASGDRSTIYELLRHYLVSGNVIARMLKNAKLRYYRLDQFVVFRDLDGGLAEFIIKETISYDSLDDDIKASVPEKTPDGSDRKDVDVYTHVKKVDGRFREVQIVEGKEVDGTEGFYPDEMKMPWRVLRHTEIPTENYGRAFTEDVLPDLETLDSLTQSVVEGLALAVKIILGVKPGFNVDAKKLAKARNGDVVTGDLERGITKLTFADKLPDLRAAESMIDRLERRLQLTFLLNSAVQRNAERVTAAEIRLMAQELEAALGGFYSRLTSEFQVWYIVQRMRILEKADELPKLPDDLIAIQVIGGIDALGRASELDKLDQFLLGIAETFGPQALTEIINRNDYIRRRAAALGIDPRNLVRTEGETRNQQLQQMGDQVVTDAAQPAANAVVQAVAQGTAEQQ